MWRLHVQCFTSSQPHWDTIDPIDFSHHKGEQKIHNPEIQNETKIYDTKLTTIKKHNQKM